ncbi:TPA: winged helix-turn-helix transcriptional regulator [Legionella pneumophila]
MATRNKVLREACPLEAALDVIGGKWKGIIIYHLFNGKLRFNMLHRVIPAITHRMLTRQLRQLERDGVVMRWVQTEGQVQVEYSLSDFGMALKPILLSLRTWGYQFKTP